jgi:acyl transferase domain-containing protein
MEPAAKAFLDHVRTIELREPEIPFISNVSGTWITPEQTTDPSYWATQLLSPVRFGDAVTALLENPDRVLLEVGPGTALTSLTKQNADAARGRTVLASLPHPKDPEPNALHSVLDALGRLWSAGTRVDWAAHHGESGRTKVPLPSYPFERSLFWIQAPTSGPSPATGAEPLADPSPSTAPDHGDGKGNKHGRPETGTEFTEPGDEIEQLVVGVWESLLGINGIGSQDDFFELGGNSLLAVRILSRLNESLGLELPIEVLFQATTVAELAEELKTAKWLAESQADAGPQAESGEEMVF